MSGKWNKKKDRKTEQSSHSNNKGVCVQRRQNSVENDIICKHEIRLPSNLRPTTRECVYLVQYKPLKIHATHI